MNRATAARPIMPGLDRAHDDQELGEESAEGRDADDRESAEKEGHRGEGHGLDQAAHLADVPLVGARG